MSPAENPQRAEFLASFPLVQEEGRTSWNMHNAVVVAAAAVDDDHVAAAIRQQHSRADMVDMRSAAVHTVRTCTPGGAIPEEYRSRREHLGNDNWSEMGTAGHNRMQWPAAAAAAAEIAVTVRSSEVDSRRNVGTGSGRSREADEAVEEGDRHSRTRQIRTPKVHKHPHEQQCCQHVPDHPPRGCDEDDALYYYFPSRHEPPGPSRPRRRPGHDAPHRHGGHRHGAAAEAGHRPDLRQGRQQRRRSPCLLADG